LDHVPKGYQYAPQIACALFAVSVPCCPLPP
jgi:hypothetical protein